MDLDKKIEQALQELRVIIPGVQALLGFQFSTMFTQVFTDLPPNLKYVHLTALLLITLSAVLLMSPAVYHRIANQGKESQRLVVYTSKIIIAALMILALGFSIDLFLIVTMITKSHSIALSAAILELITIYSLWFGYTKFKKQSS